MNKSLRHHLWTKLRPIKPLYFLLVAIIALVIGIIALRANNEQMIKLRAAVYTADEYNGNVQGALDKLQAYVTAHMNTNLSAGPNAVYPPIQLKYTYDRLVDAESNAAASANSQLYTNAQTYCQQQDPIDFSGHNRVPCIESYVESHDAALPSIPDDLYKFDFISPMWSPDLAGWSLVVAVLAFLLFVVRLVVGKFLRT